MAFNFSENETVDSIEKVPAEFRAYYQAGEGGAHTIRDDMKPATAAWDGMAKANATVRQQVKDLSKGKIDMSPLSEFGSSPQEIRDAFDGRIQEMSGVIESKKGAVDPEKLRKQMTEGFEVKEKAHLERNQALQDQLYTTLVRDWAETSAVGASAMESWASSALSLSEAKKDLSADALSSSPLRSRVNETS